MSPSPNADSGRVISRAALINHPWFGSLWLEDASIENGHVVGKVKDGNGYTEPMWTIMNFPLACVRKWEPPLPLNACPSNAGSVAGVGPKGIAK